MPWTRTVLEQRLIRGHRRLLEMLSLSTDADGANALIGDALETALLRMGYAVATPGSMTDADLAGVPAGRLAWFYSVADVCLKELLLANFRALPDEYQGPDRVDFAGIAKGLASDIKDAWETIDKRYSAGRAVPVSGLMAPKPIPPDSYAERWYP